MKDIDIAKELLVKEDLALVAVKNGEVVFKSKDKGIKPMYILATEMKARSYDASLADRVIGKGAAILCTYIGIKEVYGELISEGGLSILEEYKIPYTMERSCSYIKNRDKTDYCPIEKLSLDTKDPIVLLQRIKEFFISINNN
ncbi:DUF1893 domain-containing protein [Tissierella praeacuta]|uniref:DUF1893 domain-containing protein n=1 Tax=Tissierella praeacuta TaxID=43131 RepID=UPI000ED874EF|nr:DUF1893 domain-containing protein [Tissierella praeacuta]MBU5255061.1 DUF1893 domain-containing protein [Tissierella praeacuta]HAE91966.1 DUF1893 domain-containing protein [Tissierella sp.]